MEPPIDTETASALTGAVEIVAEGSQGCARLSDGTVACWGTGWFGGESPERRPRARRLEGLSEVRALDLGPAGGCAVTADEALWCWGHGARRALLNGASPALGRVEGVQATAIALADNFACAVLAQGAVQCWGTPDGDKRTLALSGRAVALQAAGEQACALDATGKVTCTRAWRDPQPWESPVPIQALSVGPYHLCGLAKGGDLWCSRYERDKLTPPGKIAEGVRSLSEGGFVGADGRARLLRGHGMAQPVELADVTSLDEAAARYGTERSVCALRTSGEVWCWGAMGDGRLGTGAVPTLPGPRPVFEARGPLTVGRGLACGELRCVPLDHARDRLPQRGQTPLKGIEELAFFGPVACGRTAGAVTCSAELPSLTKALAAAGPIARLIGGESVGCALTSEGRALCAGADDVFWDTPAPPPIALPEVLDLDLGASWGCLLDKQGRAFGFGAPFKGTDDAGPGVALLYTERAGARSPITGEHIACSGETVCAWGEGSEIVCADQQRAPGSFGPLTPVQFSAPVAEADLSMHKLCARLTDGTVACIDTSWLLSAPGAALAAWPVGGVSGAVRLDMDEGGSSGCIVTAEEVSCWEPGHRLFEQIAPAGPAPVQWEKP